MEAIKNEVLKYAEMQLRYYKFEVVEKFGETRAKLIVKAILTFIGLIFTIFSGLTLALYLSEIFNSFYKGFGVVSLIFAVLVIIGFILRKYLFNFFFRDYLDKNIPS